MQTTTTDSRETMTKDLESYRKMLVRRIATGEGYSEAALKGWIAELEAKLA